MASPTLPESLCTNLYNVEITTIHSDDELDMIHTSTGIQMPSSFSEEFDSSSAQNFKSRPAWYQKFFEPLKDKSMRKHRCLLCGWVGMALPNSLNNLRRHFESISKNKDCKEKYLIWKRGSESVQPSIKSVIKGTKNVPFDSQNKIDNLLAQFIISTEVPFQFVENPSSRKFCNALNPKYKVPYRVKLKNTLLIPLLEKSNEELGKKLFNCQYVSLTIDGCSSRRQLSLVSLVVNFVDACDNLCSELLTLSFFKGKHTGEKIAEFTKTTATQWCITDKIVRVGSDNAANMKKAFDTTLEIEIENEPLNDEIEIDDDDDELQEIEENILENASISIFEYLSELDTDSITYKLRINGLLPVWGRCVCHLIQLAVNDFFQMQLGSHGAVNKIISKVQNFVNSARKSIHCGEIFVENHFTLNAMNKTRWDSVFTMITSVLNAETKGLLKLLPPLKYPLPKNYELSILRDVVDVLEPIHLFTLEFQNSLGTCGMIIPGLEALYNHLNDIDQDYESMPQIMLRIVKKRFLDVVLDNFMFIAYCMDPRFAITALAKAVQNNALETLKEALHIVLRHEKDHTTRVLSPKKISHTNKRKSLFDNQTTINVISDSSNTDLDVIENELFIYKSEAKLVKQIIDTNPVIWWREHRNRMQSCGFDAFFWSNQIKSNRSRIKSDQIKSFKFKS